MPESKKAFQKVFSFVCSFVLFACSLVKNLKTVNKQILKCIPDKLEKKSLEGIDIQHEPIDFSISPFTEKSKI